MVIIIIIIIIITSIISMRFGYTPHFIGLFMGSLLYFIFNVISR